MAKLPVPFTLKGIKTIEFATLADSYKEGETVNIDNSIDFGIHQQEHSLLVQYGVTLKSAETPFAILKIACYFEVDPQAFEKFRNEEQSKVIVPKDLFTHMFVLTVGTARGVLHAKLEGTRFSQFILPTLDTSQIIQEDVVFDEAAQ
jgi:hypothetical protein